MRGREPDQRRAPEIDQHRVVRIAGLDLVTKLVSRPIAGNEPAQSIVGATWPGSTGEPC